jgi:hypothetical protein
VVADLLGGVSTGAMIMIAVMLYNEWSAPY